MHKTKLSAGIAAAIILGATVPAVSIQANEKITICHAAGQDDTLHYVTLTLSRNAVFQDQGNGGHFYENGTPKAGHEHDYIGECQTEDVEPTDSPELTDSPEPTSTPDSSDDSSTESSDSSSNSDNTNTSSTDNVEGQILGAYADTGVVGDVIMNGIGYLGGLMTAVGSMFYGKKKNSR